MHNFLTLGAIEWTELTSGLKTAFESGVEDVLPVAAVILAAFVVFKAIRRFAKSS
jgi:hypothetical protein